MLRISYEIDKLIPILKVYENGVVVHPAITTKGELPYICVADANNARTTSEKPRSLAASRWTEVSSHLH